MSDTLATSSIPSPQHTLLDGRHPTVDAVTRRGNGSSIAEDPRMNAGIASGGTLERQQSSGFRTKQERRADEDKQEKGKSDYRYKGIAPDAPRESFNVRIRGFTFAWFTICMATAGLSIILGRLPAAYACNGTRILGQVVFVIDLVLFVVFHAILGWRFYLYPKAFKAFLEHPVESSYLCAWLQAFATIIVCAEIYGTNYTGFWLRKALVVLWIVEFVLAVGLALYLPLVHFVDHPRAHKRMPPSFMLLPTIIIYASTIGYSLIPGLPAYTAIWVFWVSYCLLGLGFLLQIFYLAMWFCKLLAGGLYCDKHAITPFMIVGMTSYTAGGFFGLANVAKKLFPAVSREIGQPYMSTSTVVDGVVFTQDGSGAFWMVNICLGLLFYGFAWWCLLVSFSMTIWVVVHKRCSPSLSAMLSPAFPTTGLILDTWEVASIVGWTGQPSGVRWLDILGIVMLIVWVIMFCAGLLGVTFKIYKRRLLWEGKDDNAPGFGYLGEFYQADHNDMKSHRESA